MRLLKFSDISTNKLYVVKLCSIYFLVFVCKGLHEINSSDTMSVLCYISGKASVKRYTSNLKITLLTQLHLFNKCGRSQMTSRWSKMGMPVPLTFLSHSDIICDDATWNLLFYTLTKQK